MIHPRMMLNDTIMNTGPRDHADEHGRRTGGPQAINGVFLNGYSILFTQAGIYLFRARSRLSGYNSQAVFSKLDALSSRIAHSMAGRLTAAFGSLNPGRGLNSREMSWSQPQLWSGSSGLLRRSRYQAENPVLVPASWASSNFITNELQ